VGIPSNTVGARGVPVVMQSRFGKRARRMSSIGIELFFDSDYDRAKAKLLGLVPPDCLDGGPSKPSSHTNRWKRSATKLMRQSASKKPLSWNSMAKNMKQYGLGTTKSVGEDVFEFWNHQPAEMPGSDAVEPSEVAAGRPKTPVAVVHNFVTALVAKPQSGAGNRKQLRKALSKKALKLAKRFKKSRWHDMLLLPNPTPAKETKAVPAPISLMDPENNAEYNQRAASCLVDDDVSRAQRIGSDMDKLQRLIHDPTFQSAAASLKIDVGSLLPKDASSFAAVRSGVKFAAFEEKVTAQMWEDYLKWELGRVKRLALVLAEAKKLAKAREKVLRAAISKARDQDMAELMPRRYSIVQPSPEPIVPKPVISILAPSSSEREGVARVPFSQAAQAVQPSSPEEDLAREETPPSELPAVSRMPFKRQSLSGPSRSSPCLLPDRRIPAPPPKPHAPLVPKHSEGCLVQREIPSFSSPPEDTVREKEAPRRRSSTHSAPRRSVSPPFVTELTSTRASATKLQAPPSAVIPPEDPVLRRKARTPTEESKEASPTGVRAPVGVRKETSPPSAQSMGVLGSSPVRSWRASPPPSSRGLESLDQSWKDTLGGPTPRKSPSRQRALPKAVTVAPGFGLRPRQSPVSVVSRVQQVRGLQVMS
jgi:hypothetical protein